MNNVVSNADQTAHISTIIGGVLSKYGHGALQVELTFSNSIAQKSDR